MSAQDRRPGRGGTGDAHTGPATSPAGRGATPAEAPAGRSAAEEHKVLGARLREARETLGLVQADTAEALGVPRTSVAAMEAGTRKVTGLELRRMARLYRRPVAWLLGEDDDGAAPAAGSGRDVLFRATEPLSEQDREQVLRFAQFLAARTPSAPRPSASRGAARRPRPPKQG